MYQLNPLFSFSEDKLLAHIPPANTGDKYNINMLRCMNYVSQHYSSLEQQINNTYEIETGFFFFCTPKTIFSLYFWSDEPDDLPAFVAISIDSEKTKAFGSPYYNVELHYASLKFLSDDVMPNLSKHLIEICSNLKRHFSSSPDEVNFLTLYEQKYLNGLLTANEFNHQMKLPMFQYSRNVSICNYIKQYGNDLLFNKPFTNAPLFLESFPVTHLFNVWRGRNTPLRQLFWDIRDLSNDSYGVKMAKSLVERELGHFDVSYQEEKIMEKIDSLLNELISLTDDLGSYSFKEMKPSLFGIPFKHTFSKCTIDRARDFYKNDFVQRAKGLKTCFVQPIFKDHYSIVGILADEKYAGVNRTIHFEAVSKYLENYHANRALIYKYLTELPKLIKENPFVYSFLTPQLDNISDLADRFTKIDAKLQEELEFILSHFKDIEVI